MASPTRRLVGATSVVAWTVLVWLTAIRVGRGQVVLRQSSPSGEYVAEVRSRPALDPPAQGLWLGARASAPKKVYTLGEDSEWADQIVWSADSAQVAFLVSGARAIVVDANSGRLVATVQLVPADGQPTSRQVRWLRFADDGRHLAFRACARRSTACDAWSEIALGRE